MAILTQLRITPVILALFAMMIAGSTAPGPAQASLIGYNVTQVTTNSVDHKWPSVNRHGDIVWSERDGFGFWQVIKKPASGGATQLITSGAKHHERPVIADDGTIAYFEYIDGDLLSRKVIKRDPSGNETTAEFSSSDPRTGAQRSAGQYFGMTGGGHVITAYDFRDRFGVTVRRFSFNGSILTDPAGNRIDFLLNGGPYDHPDINDDGLLIYAKPSASNWYSTQRSDPLAAARREFADGKYPRVSNNSSLLGGNPYYVYIDSSEKLVILSGSENNCGPETEDSVNWVDVAVDASGRPLVVYEKTIGSPSSYAQIFLATLDSASPDGDYDRDCIANSVDRMLFNATAASVRDQSSAPSIAFSDGNTSGHVFDRLWFYGPRQAIFQAAARQGERSDTIDAIVMHYCGNSPSGFYDYCRDLLSINPARSDCCSAHYAVSRVGQLYRLVKDERKAIHARYYNDRSIGIEPDGKGKPADWTSRMRETVVSLVARLLSDHPGIEAAVGAGPLHPTQTAPTFPTYQCLNVPGIVGHQQIQPINAIPSGSSCPYVLSTAVADKYDPGPNFGWGNWDAFVSRVLDRKASLADAPTVVVTDASDRAKGVRIQAIGGTPPFGSARVVFHCSAQDTTAPTEPVPLADDVLRLTGGEDVIVTCGSMIYEVLTGPVEIEVGDDIVVNVPSGGEVKLSKASRSDVEIENLSASGVQITVTEGTDSRQVSSGTSTLVATRPANTPPVAKVGADQTASLGAVVTLDGAASYDPDGQPITYSWEPRSGPAALLDDPTIAKPSFVATEPGLYELDLRIDDGIDQDIATVLVAVDVGDTTVRGSGLLYPRGGVYHATFSVDVRGPINPRGLLKYYDSQRRANFVATAITSLNGGASTVYIEGKGSLNRVADHTFIATLYQEDQSQGLESGIALSILDPEGRTVYELEREPLTSGAVSIQGDVDILPPPAETE